MGDPRPPAGRRCLRQVQRAFRLLHQSNPAQQAGRWAALSRASALPRSPAAMLAAAPALRLLRLSTGKFTTKESS